MCALPVLCSFCDATRESRVVRHELSQLNPNLRTAARLHKQHTRARSKGDLLRLGSFSLRHAARRRHPILSLNESSSSLIVITTLLCRYATSSNKPTNNAIMNALVSRSSSQLLLKKNSLFQESVRSQVMRSMTVISKKSAEDYKKLVRF